MLHRLAFGIENSPHIYPDSKKKESTLIIRILQLTTHYSILSGKKSNAKEGYNDLSDNECIYYWYRKI